MKKKIKLLGLVGIILSCLFAMPNTFSAIESTPFKVPRSALTVIADVRNFAYNCVMTDEGATVYELMSNTYATTGSMYVTVYCVQFKTTVKLPLILQDNKITTPLTTYPIKFDDTMPEFCRHYTAVSVKKDPSFPGYTIEAI